MITVVIPVGPKESHQRWLDKALDSVFNQTLPPTEILLVNDMAVVDLPKNNPIPIRMWFAPWRLGVAHAFNMGVSLAKTECVFLLGSDDTLEPTCLEECYNMWETYTPHENVYYWVGVRYMDTGEEQQLPCNAAMVTKSLWRRCGGFPVEATTAPDAALISIMLVHGEAGILRQVNANKPLYNYRRHSETDTVEHGEWWDTIIKGRDLLTKNWQPPQWGRYE